MPYLHWDSADSLKHRDEIIKHRLDVQAAQEQMLRNPAAGCRDPFVDRKTIHSKIDLEKKVEAYHHDLSQRSRLLYDFVIAPQDKSLHPTDAHLHPRRSLDQYGHPFLEDMFFKPEEDRKLQVLYKCGLETESSKNDVESRLTARVTEATADDAYADKMIDSTGATYPSNVLMVDQLWCWIIDSGYSKSSVIH